MPSFVCCCRAMLFGGLSESQPGVSVIELKDERPQAFSVLLSYIYTGRVRLSQLKVSSSKVVSSRCSQWLSAVDESNSIAISSIAAVIFVFCLFSERIISYSRL